MTRDNRITPIEIGCAITKSATTIEELVNQLERFVAYDWRNYNWIKLYTFLGI